MSDANKLLRQPMDQIHPDTIVPDGYEWLLPGELITTECLITRHWEANKWHEMTIGRGEKYKPGVHWPTVRPISKAS